MQLLCYTDVSWHALPACFKAEVGRGRGWDVGLWGRAGFRVLISSVLAKSGGGCAVCRDVACVAGLRLAVWDGLSVSV